MAGCMSGMVAKQVNVLCGVFQTRAVNPGLITFEETRPQTTRPQSSSLPHRHDVYGFRRNVQVQRGSRLHRQLPQQGSR